MHFYINYKKDFNIYEYLGITKNKATRITNKLNKSGYDKRRWQKFKNLPVDVFIAQPIIESLNLDV